MESAVKFNRIYESKEVVVLLISSAYNTDYSVSDYNTLPSISFPLQGAFIYQSGKFKSIASTNVVLIERENIEFRVTKFEAFNYDCTLCFQFREKDLGLFGHILDRGKCVRMLRRTPQTESRVRRFLSVYRTKKHLLIDQIIEELLIDDILGQTFSTLGNTGVKPWLRKKIDLAKDFIYSEFSTDISLADISEASHISLFHFSRIFKKLTGYSPYAYLLQVRIVEAQRLLREGSSVTSTAFETGFNSVANFSYRFKEIVGISPSEYQKSNKSKTR